MQKARRQGIICFALRVAFGKMASLFAAAHGLALQDGLVTPHAYSLLSVKEVGGLRMVCLRNPWGRGGGKEWLGGWKDGAQETFGGGGVEISLWMLIAGPRRPWLLSGSSCFFPNAQRRVPVQSLGVWGLDPCSPRVSRRVGVASSSGRRRVVNSVSMGEAPNFSFSKVSKQVVMSFAWQAWHFVTFQPV